MNAFPKHGGAPSMSSLGRAAMARAAMLVCLSLAAATSAPAATVMAMEYYIDTDPGKGLATPIPSVNGTYGNSSATGQVAVATGNLKVGPHLVYVRAKSSTGVWGTYPPELLYIYDRPTVAAAEYFIDNDPGLGNGTALQPVDGGMDYVQEMITATTVPLTGLAMGSHTLYIRARNSRELWGPTRAIPFDVLRTRFIAGAECSVGGSADTAPTGATYAMDPVNYPFDSPVEEVVKTGMVAPAQVGTYRAFVRTTDSLNLTSAWAYAEFVVTTNPLWVTSTNLPSAVQNTVYATQLAASGGQPPYTWGLVPDSPSLPQGLALSTSGLLSGTPTVSGTSYFVIQVTDSAASAVSQSLSLTVSAAVARPTLFSPTWSANGQFQFSFGTLLGANYLIQYSTTLTDWTTLVTASGSGLALTFLDTNSLANRQRFYRVILEP